MHIFSRTVIPSLVSDQKPLYGYLDLGATTRRGARISNHANLVAAALVRARCLDLGDDATCNTTMGGNCADKCGHPRAPTTMNTALHVVTLAMSSAVMAARARSILSAWTWCSLTIFQTNGIAMNVASGAIPLASPSIKAFSRARSSLWRRAFPGPLAFPKRYRLASRASRLGLMAITKK
jgi:hypothetical protein